MSDQFATDGKSGVIVSRIDPTTGDNLQFLGPCFKPGTQVFTENRGSWVYTKLPAITQIGSAIFIDPTTWTGVLATTTTAAIATGLQYPIGFAPTAANVGDYGWLQHGGIVDNVYVGASCVRNVALNTTATGGMLDDDGTSGAIVLSGIVITTTRAASNGVAPGWAQGCVVASQHA